MKLYMLDTDMCSYIIKEHPVGVQQRFRKMAMEQLCISVVTYTELDLWGRTFQHQAGQPPCYRGLRTAFRCDGLE